MMKLKLLFGCFLWAFLLLFSCRDEIQFSESTKALKISSDTLVLDSAYNNVRSETYAIKIFNQENKDIEIPHIFLEKGDSSPFKINIDGQSGKTFQNIPIRKGDSLFIFVEIAPKINQKESVVEDKIIFGTKNPQHITLLSPVEDTNLLISTKEKPYLISENTTWSSEKSKIIYGNIRIKDGKTLTINEGTKIYFHKNSGLIVGENAQLIINGNLSKKVILRGDKRSTKYDTLPANWNGIQTEKNAKIEINHAKIFGGNTALSLNESNAKIKNTIIHTFLEHGIVANNSKIDAVNLVMNNFGISDIKILKSGEYNFIHCTLSNFWKKNTIESKSVIKVDNQKSENQALTLNIKNSILYTQNPNALVFNETSSQINYFIDSSLLKYEENSFFNWENNSHIANSIKNVNPEFKNTSVEKLNLSLKETSPIKGKANLEIANQYPKDIREHSRTSHPTIGAYQ